MFCLISFTAYYEEEVPSYDTDRSLYRSELPREEERDYNEPFEDESYNYDPSQEYEMGSGEGEGYDVDLSLIHI